MAGSCRPRLAAVAVALSLCSLLASLNTPAPKALTPRAHGTVATICIELPPAPEALRASIHSQSAPSASRTRVQPIGSTIHPSRPFKSSRPPSILAHNLEFHSVPNLKHATPHCTKSARSTAPHYNTTMASSSFRDSMNSLGWSRHEQTANTNPQNPLLGTLSKLNPFSGEGYVRLPTTEGEGPGAPLPARTRREEDEGWFARKFAPSTNTGPVVRSCRVSKACFAR